MVSRPLFLAVLLAALPASSMRAADAPPILNETGYLRQYYRFGVNRYSINAVKAEGETVLGKTGMDRVRRDTEKLMVQVGADPAKTDWREHVVQPIFESYRPVPAPVLPDDWTNPIFDDHAWVLARGPFQWTKPAAITTPQLGQFEESSMDMALQQAFYRARFIVADPAQAGDLALSISYVGGVRAWINGQEIARGHLPAGALSADAPGEDYPLAAYKPEGETLRQRNLGPVPISAKLLVRGINVLSIETRASQFHPVVLTNPRQENWGGPTRPWPHGRLIGFALSSGTAHIPSALVRPGGTAVWAADLHQRVQSSDFLPPGELPGSIRMIGARNGTCAGQIVIGTDKVLAGLRITAGELRQTNGTGVVPATAISISHLAAYPLEEWTIARLGDERGLGATFPESKALSAFAAVDPARVSIFDRLSNEVPKNISANTSRPVWISLRIPADAAPGTYRGEISVTADAMPAASIPVEVEIVNWSLPSPKDFQTFVGCEQNPYGVARHYGVAPWSDAHFKLIETSFQQLGRVGNKWLNVPVVINTEFGNKADSLIPWIRKAGGRWGFDYNLLDRYLDQAIKHCGPPRAVQFVIMQGMKSQVNPPAAAQVKVIDETTGKEEIMDAPSSQRQAWQAFAASLYEHMKSRGLERSMYWGAPLEQEADPELKNLLAACTPAVHWTAGPHEMMFNGTYAKNDKFYQLITTIRYWPGGWPGFRGDQGWKSKTTHLLNPRVGGTVFALHTTSLPFAYRVLPQRAVSLGRNGFARVGADEWDAVHYDGMSVPKWLTGMPVLFMLWPGPAGAQPSTRFECLLEGIQETEARIFLEQSLDRGQLDEATAGRIRQVLAENSEETTFFQGNSIVYAFEAYHYRWQDRSARLYRAAAEVAAEVAAGKAGQ